MKKLFITTTLLCAFALCSNAQNTPAKSQAVNAGVTKEIRSAAGDTETMRVIWGKTGHRCSTGGLYCYIKPYKRKIDDFDAKSLEPDATLTTATIDVVGANIMISAIGQVSNLSKETLANFQNNKVELPEAGFPKDFFKGLLRSVNLNIPTADITFSPKDQKYAVVNTTYEGKAVKIIEAYQRSKITIDGKTYNLLVVTTSGKGSGSPKQAGF